MDEKLIELVQNNSSDIIKLLQKYIGGIILTLEDKKGNIWFGGNDGLWRLDGNSFTNFTQKFVGYIYEDKKGNIWTSSESSNTKGWALSRYDENSLNNDKATVTELKTLDGMFVGILEDNDGSIWVGTLNGVYQF